MTAYEKVKGREYSGVMLEFGSIVLYKVSAKVQGGVMAPRWMKGVWLGKRFVWGGRSVVRAGWAGGAGEGRCVAVVLVGGAVCWLTEVCWPLCAGAAKGGRGGPRLARCDVGWLFWPERRPAVGRHLPERT